MLIKPPPKETAAEEAIKMLVAYVGLNCRNPKPVILHSIRVGLTLLQMGQPKEVVAAGILHDLIEDTNCKIKLIEKKFGKRTANLVLSLTQEHIEDYQERWRILLGKIKKAGRPAMVIKIIDANDNLNYVPLIKKSKVLKETLWKHRFLLKELAPFLKQEKLFRDYKQKYKAISSLKTSTH